MVSVAATDQIKGHVSRLLSAHENDTDKMNDDHDTVIANYVLIGDKIRFIGCRRQSVRVPDLPLFRTFRPRLLAPALPPLYRCFHITAHARRNMEEKRAKTCVPSINELGRVSS